MRMQYTMLRLNLHFEMCLALFVEAFLELLKVYIYFFYFFGSYISLLLNSKLNWIREIGVGVL